MDSPSMGEFMLSYIRSNNPLAHRPYTVGWLNPRGYQRRVKRVVIPIDSAISPNQPNAKLMAHPHQNRHYASR
jgi:hypothetical protein